MSIRRRGPLARAACLFLMLCAGSGAIAQSSDGECPDLSGTYEVRSTAWIDMYHLSATGTVRPKSQKKQFATLTRRDNGFNLTWHMPRQEVLAAARSEAERDPRKYGLWLDMVLRDPKLPLPLGVSEQEWFNRVANYGPVFRVDVVLPLKQCKSGWLLVGGASRDGPAVSEGGMSGTRDEELWLGRDQDGSLSLKWQEYRTMVFLSQRYFTVRPWRLWSSASMDKWPASPALDLAPLRAEELPQDRRRPKVIPKCQITGDHEAAFYQRLKANFPPKVQIENYSLSIVSGRMRPDGICEGTAYTLTVSAPDAASIAKVADYLRTDPFIRQIDSQKTTQTWGDGSLWVKFYMMASP